MRRELTPVLDKSTDGLSVSATPTRAVRVDLEGRFQSAAVARRNADGTIETECFEDVESAIEFMNGEGSAVVEVK